jgi:tetraacyldisaccharide 4'-kinase
VARDRVAGAAQAKAQGASVIVMDDGLQNPSLKKDLALAVIDARRGIGNARVFPAGPLRAPLAAQLAATDASLVVGSGDDAAAVIAELRRHGRPVLHGRLVADTSTLGDLRARRVLAFAGIGDPEKFFAGAEAAGLTIAARVPFPDHHRFSAEDAAKLVLRAEQEGLALLTTEKDRARMAGEPPLAALAERSHVLPVTMAIDEMDVLRGLLTAALRR